MRQLEKPFHREKLEKIGETENLTKAETNTWSVNGDFYWIHKRMLMGGGKKSIYFTSLSQLALLLLKIYVWKIFFLTTEIFLSVNPTVMLKSP